ncbi:hypothetical protein DFJ74DRAFT_90589, partial [Hyaloraphidium curvatum]
MVAEADVSGFFSLPEELRTDILARLGGSDLATFASASRLAFLACIPALSARTVHDRNFRTIRTLRLHRRAGERAQLYREALTVPVRLHLAGTDQLGRRTRERTARKRSLRMHVSFPGGVPGLLQHQEAPLPWIHGRGIPHAFPRPAKDLGRQRCRQRRRVPQARPYGSFGNLPGGAQLGTRPWPGSAMLRTAARGSLPPFGGPERAGNVGGSRTAVGTRDTSSVSLPRST